MKQCEHRYIHAVKNRLGLYYECKIGETHTHRGDESLVMYCRYCNRPASMKTMSGLPKVSWEKAWMLHQRRKWAEKMRRIGRGIIKINMPRYGGGKGEDKNK